MCKEEFVWETSLFWLHALLSMLFFVAFFVYSLPLPKWRTCWMAPIKIHNISMMVFCVMILWVNSRKYVNFLQFSTSCLASLRTWYYFRLFFSFNCSGYDLALIKKCRTLNFYSFSQKFLLETKIDKIKTVGNCGSSIYC